MYLRRIRFKFGDKHPTYRDTTKKQITSSECWMYVVTKNVVALSPYAVNRILNGCGRDHV